MGYAQNRFGGRVAACVLAVALAGCSTTAPPVSLPQHQPVRLILPEGGANVSMSFITFVPGAGFGQQMLQGALEEKVQANSERLRNEQRFQQQKNELADLFRSEVVRRFEAKGGRLASQEERSAPTIRLENLTAAYLASSALASYQPVAFVYISASTDPSHIGNRPGGLVRSIEARPREGYAFISADTLLADVQRANQGMRESVVELAEKVATELAVAQNGSSRGR